MDIIIVCWLKEKLSYTRCVSVDMSFCRLTMSHLSRRRERHHQLSTLDSVTRYLRQLSHLPSRGEDIIGKSLVLALARLCSGTMGWRDHEVE